MSRIFSMQSAIAIAMILASGLGVYWTTKTDLARSGQTTADALAEAAASKISARIDVLNQVIENMARDPEVIAAVAGNDSASIAAVTGKLERIVPDARKIRLLPPDVTELDVRNSPKMSLADLDMVREALDSEPMSAVHGDTAEDRHLAIARKVTRDDKTVGVILASLKYDFIANVLKRTQLDKGGFLELRQNKLVLAVSGARNDQDRVVGTTARVGNTRWELEYHAPDSASAGFPILAGIIILPCVIFIAVSWWAYRKLAMILMNDLSSLMSAFKDIMKNKLQGSYPVGLKEFNVVISSLAQYKRLQDQETEAAADPEDDADTMIDLLWDELDLGEDTLVIQPDDAKTAQHPAADLKPAAAETPIDKPIDTDAIFRAYDIRGIAGTTLTREIVYNIGRALGTEARSQACTTLVVGRDGRTSSQELAESLIQGIVATGCNVMNIGMVPTPLLYFVAWHIEGRSGVMVTGSHNPPRYNGLKMVIKGETLAGDRIRQLKRCIDSQAFAAGTPGTIERNERFANEYIGTISEDIHIARPMKVVLDCGNGVAGKIGPVLLRTLGCEVVELFCTVDGTFPNHHPDPGKPENLSALIKAVKQNQADVGIALDGDGDRLGVVDSSGRIIWPDRQMMLFARDVLAVKPGSEIVFDVKCSRHLPRQITKYGGRPVMWKTGHSHMKAKLRETGAKLAGEMSGHIFFNDRWFGFDDGLYAASRLIEILSADSRSSAEVFGELPDSFNTPELTVDMAEGEHFKFMEHMVSNAKFADGKLTTLDGLRVDFPDGWGLVRASNTTPSLVIRFEADTQDALKTIQDRFRQELKNIKPDIALPF
ncbi:MAG: phosphomannomutase/phosphoglucomutase [Gammaproteobacteria bacterium]